jgi:hypothetical protein
MRRDERAVSEVLGYVLVFTLILSSVAFVSVGVANSLADRSETESVNNAEAAFNVLADNVEDVYARGAPSRATEISLETGSLSTGENVTLEVRLVDTDATPTTHWPGPTASDWKTWRFRPLVFESDGGATVAYEAGAVYRIGATAAAPESVASADDRASLRKRDPPFVVEGAAGNEQVLLPVVHLTASTRQSLSGGTVLIRTGTERTSLASVKEYDDEDTYDEVKVRLTGTPRYLEWQEYFLDAGFESCSTDDSQERVTCTYTAEGGSGDDIEVVSLVGHEVPVSLEE